MRTLSSTLALLAVGAIRVWAANIVVNGSFETPTVTPGGFALFPSIPGWSLASGPSIEVQNNFNGVAFAGLQNVELDSQGNSAIYQDLVTTPGMYMLSFAYSPRPGWGENTMQVSWNGVVLSTLNSNGVGLTNTNWTVYNYNVMATGPSTRLQYASLGTSDSFGAYLDNVIVDNAAVPEPASITLCVAGLGTLLVLRRKQSAAKL